MSMRLGKKRTLFYNPTLEEQLDHHLLGVPNVHHPPKKHFTQLGVAPIITDLRHYKTDKTKPKETYPYLFAHYQTAKMWS